MFRRQTLVRILVWIYAGRPRTRLVRTACTEENELLSANSIKMTDAPFGRSDSEDDIIEDYDDVVNFKGACCKERTPLERGLLILIAVLFLVIVGLAVGLTRPRLAPHDDYCSTPQCVQAASSLMSAMNPNADPCEDFFEYACGGWVRNNPIPKGYHKWDRVQELSGQNLYVLKTLIESEKGEEGEAEKKVRNLYRSCMADGPAAQGDNLQRLRELTRDADDWSISRGINASVWFFNTALEKVHSQGAWPFFRVTVDVDERNPTLRYILKVDIGDTVLPMDVYPPSLPTSRAASHKPADVNTDQTDDTLNPSSVSHPQDAGSLTTTATTTATTTTTTTSGGSTAGSSSVRQLFVDEAVHILQAMGFSISAAYSRAEQLLGLEKRIAAASEGRVQNYDRRRLYNPVRISDLDRLYGLLPWVQYFKTLGFDVTSDDEVVVLHPGYLANVTALISDVSGKEADKSLLRDYMMLMLVRSFKPYFDLSLFRMDDTDEDLMQEQWKRCAFYTNKALGFATGAIFVRETGQEGSVTNVQKLISYVREAFKEYVLRTLWIDDNTRIKAAQKVDNIINKISYPSYILNSTFLDAYYKQFEVQESASWFDNLLFWRKFELTHMNSDLISVPDRKQSWIRPPVTVNAFYSPVRNDVIFPIAMFHLPYYISDGPSAVNFGAMGSVIGHEITHALDIQGRQYDQEGRLDDWWEPHTLYYFNMTTQCMVRQYSDISVDGQQVDGDFTLDENIADNGGLRAARYAYMKWVEDHGEEPALPSVNLTQYQVFFLSYAQMYCSKWTPMGLTLHLLTDPHSPGKARVNGALANSKTFSWAFQCPVYSAMNAQTKCTVW